MKKKFYFLKLLYHNFFRQILIKKDEKLLKKDENFILYIGSDLKLISKLD